MRATDGIWRFSPARIAVRHAAVMPVLAASILLLLVAAIFLVARRAAGALVAPLSFIPLLATALAVTAFAWAVRVLAPRSDVAPGPHRAEWFLFTWGPSLVVWLMMCACAFPPARVIDWIVWLPVLAVDWWTRRWWSAQPSSADRLPALAAERDESEAQATVTLAKPPTSGQLLQHLSRFRRTDGGEAIHGMLTAEFAPGAQDAALHVAFCPPLGRLPHVGAEAIDGPPASVRVVQVLHNGARVDVRLFQPADAPTAVSVELLAAEPEE